MSASSIITRAATTRAAGRTRSRIIGLRFIPADPAVGAQDRAIRASATRRRQFSAASSVPAPSPQDRTPSTLIDFSVSAKIEGEESQICTVQLKPGEKLRAESASMLFMTEGVEMDTTLGGDSGAGGALSGAMKRMLTGQNVFLTDFTYQGDTTGTVALGTDFPSKILRLSLEDFYDKTLICQRGAYLASNANVQIEMAFTKTLTAGFFGGQGFILQRLSGQGDVLVKGGGTIVVHDLAPDEVLRVTSGSLVAFEASVQYDVQMMPGIKNAMFGGEGLFITTLTGPGRVYLQGMPPDRMIAEIARRVPAGGPGIGIPIGVGGSGEESGGAADEAAAVSGVDGVDGGEAAASEDAVAAADASVQAERDATVATSDQANVDADSPSALFGDAAPQDTASSAEDGSASSPLSDDPFSTSSTTTEPTFTEDDSFSTSSTTETTFGDDQEFASEANENITDGELFDDTTTTEGLGDAVADEDTSSGVLGLLWDLFTGGDD